MKRELEQRKRRKRQFSLILFILFAGAAIAFFLNCKPVWFGMSRRGRMAVNSSSAVSRVTSPVSSETSAAVSSAASSDKPQLPSQKIIDDVPYISQEDSYSTGCELVSAAMFLKYYRYDVSVADVVAKTPCSQLQQTENGLIGQHPSQSFIGDPTSESGFGCYAPVVVTILNSFFQQDNRIKAADITGTDFDSLLPYIYGDNPVIVWATIGMLPSYAGADWILDGTGETFTWPAQEHCLVLVGYDENKYYFNDPYGSNGLVGYDRTLVQKRYLELGKQAVVAVPA